MDLFDTYPHQPGAKTGGTSQDAAESMKVDAPTLRDRCYVVLLRHDLTADEVAERLHESILSIRPRITELNRMGLIEKVLNHTRANTSGRMANVWRAIMQPERAR